MSCKLASSVQRPLPVQKFAVRIGRSIACCGFLSMNARQIDGMPPAGVPPDGPSKNGLSIPQYFLLIEGVPPTCWVHAIAAEAKSIGRDSNRDIVLVDDNVSRRHAEIWDAGGIVMIRDVGSRNGIFVDGKPVTEASLACGCRLKLGRIVLWVADIPTLQMARDETGVGTTLDDASDDTRECLSKFTCGKS